MKKQLSRLLLLLSLLTICSNTIAQQAYPANVTQVLQKAGSNRAELEKALQYFYKKGDSLQVKAIHFLIANMDIHFSASYYWADSSGKKVSYNELAYTDFNQALQAFDSLKSHVPGIHPVAYKYKDVDSITGSLLIENVELAFESWYKGWSKNIPFEDFCEYILPYRASVEPLHNWRSTYKNKFAWVYDSTAGKPVDTALTYLASDFKKWFTNTYDMESRKEPLPRLSALQLLQRRKGPCEDIADLAVFALRSQGIIATNDMVTYWATSFGKHFCNSTLNGNNQTTRFDVSMSAVRFATFAREPAKVIRTTFSKQPGVLASIEKAQNIPKGFLQTHNYKDVTPQYWATQDLPCSLHSADPTKKIAYACVFNFQNWHPTWWGKTANGKVVFTNMTKGVVYLPVYYSNGIQTAAGYPIALGYNNQQQLKPAKSVRTVIVKQQEKYLVFRPQKKYTLYYWNNEWVQAGEKIADANTTEMAFDKVPHNALLLLVPEYSKRKERPFIIDANGERFFF